MNKSVLLITRGSDEDLSGLIDVAKELDTSINVIDNSLSPEEFNSKLQESMDCANGTIITSSGLWLICEYFKGETARIIQRQIIEFDPRVLIGIGSQNEKQNAAAVGFTSSLGIEITHKVRSINTEDGLEVEKDETTFNGLPILGSGVQCFSIGDAHQFLLRDNCRGAIAVTDGDNLKRINENDWPLDREGKEFINKTGKSIPVDEVLASGRNKHSVPPINIAALIEYPSGSTTLALPGFPSIIKNGLGYGKMDHKDNRQLVSNIVEWLGSGTPPKLRELLTRKIHNIELSLKGHVGEIVRQCFGDNMKIACNKLLTTKKLEEVSIDDGDRCEDYFSKNKTTFSDLINLLRKASTYELIIYPSSGIGKLPDIRNRIAHPTTSNFEQKSLRRDYEYVRESERQLECIRVKK